MGDLVDSTMRTSSILLPLALLALLSVAAFAAEEKVESVDDNVEAEDDPAKEGKEELAKMDLNKDGKADLAEVTEYMKKEFYGPEDIKEDNLTPAQVDEKAAQDAKEYLDGLDKNKDSFLDEAEFTAHYKEDMDDVDSELDESEEGEEDDSAADEEGDEDAEADE